MTAAGRLAAIIATNVAEYSRRAVATFRWEACLLLSKDRARVMVEHPLMPAPWMAAHGRSLRVVVPLP
jgi:hypothetical protein